MAETPKYEKPKAQSLGKVAAAEGACATGGGPTGSTCTSGSTTDVCAGGGTAVRTPISYFCRSGAAAANCLNGAGAGG